MPTLRTIQNNERTEILRTLTGIPPFPAVAVKALQVISSEQSQLRQLSDLISTDTAFSAELLRMANSALFGTRQEIHSVLHAILVLGLERVKGVVVTVAMRGYLGDSLEVPALRACWRHSLACAILSAELARLRLMEADAAYTAGLLHDVGRLGLIVAYPKKYADFLASAENEPCDPLQRERDLFGIDHCQAGRLLVMRWKLPHTFLLVTSRHHDAATLGEPPSLSIVRFGCTMADALGFSATIPFQPRNYEEVLDTLPLDDRTRFPTQPSEITYYIGSKINSIEAG